VASATVRLARPDELADLLGLYHVLHPEDPPVPADGARAQAIWRSICANPMVRTLVVEAEGRLSSTCTLTVIPNLTRSLRPYGVVENVVTAPEFRRRGHATRVLCRALEEAWASGCYKVMLSTGSREEDTLRFYERAGFSRGIKTGFVAYPTASSPGSQPPSSERNLPSCSAPS
jgi:GNAT superfamily N-acetyltransferase